MEIHQLFGSKSKIVRYNKMHVIHKTLSENQIDYTQDFKSTFKPLPQIADSDKHLVHHPYGLDSYWEDHIYDQDKLEYRHNYNKPAEQIGNDDINIDLHVSHTLRYALIDLWTFNPQLPGTSPLLHFTPFVHSNKTRQQLVLENEIAPQLKSTPDGIIDILLLSTYFHLKTTCGFQWISGT